MKRLLLLPLLALSLLTACVVMPGHGVVVPYLPPLVVLDVEPYYYYEGYHYHYNNDRWHYARSKRGPWADLPRDHYPKELKFKGKHRERGGHDHDERHYYDDRDRRY